MLNTLNVPISEKTLRKLGALAVLTGRSASSVETELAEMIDGVISLKIDEALAELDQDESGPSSDLDNTEDNDVGSYAIKTSSKKTKKHSAPQNNYAEESVFENIAGHSLSDDEDTGAPALSEMDMPDPEQLLRSTKAGQQPLMQKPITTDSFRVPDIDVEDVGDNVEAFLGDIETPPQSAARASSVKRKATAAGASAKPRVKVSDYNGAEDGDLF